MLDNDINGSWDSKLKAPSFNAIEKLRERPNASESKKQRRLDALISKSRVLTNTAALSAVDSGIWEQNKSQSQRFCGASSGAYRSLNQRNCFVSFSD